MLIGKWVEVAIYSKTTNGVEWIPAPPYPNGLEIKTNGEYIHTERCGNGMAFGNYVYNPSVDELLLGVVKYKVSLLDRNNLIIDNVDINHLIQKRKFRKAN